MDKTKIKKILLAVVVPLLILDTTLLFAAPSEQSEEDLMLSQFQQQLSEVRGVPSSLTQMPDKDDDTQQATSKPQSANQTTTAQQQAAPKASSQSKVVRRIAPPFVPPPLKTVGEYLEEQPSEDQAIAFEGVSEQSMPMTPDQIKAMKRMMVASQRAAAEPAETPARPVTSSKIVSLAPGVTPPVIRLSAGFISTLVFVDVTGSDWPITSIDNGNPDAFNVSWDKVGNTIMIQAKKSYTFGNIAVTLKGMSTPVMLTLVPGQKEIDYRVDLRISGLSPSSKKTVHGSSLPKAADAELLNVLDNIPPPDSTRLMIPGGAATAWLSNGKMYLRTRFVLLSPGYLSVMKSPDGTYAYELQKTPSILVSQYGKPVELRVQGV